MAWIATTPADLGTTFNAGANFDNSHALAIRESSNQGKQITYPATVGGATTMETLDSAMQNADLNNITTDKILCSWIGLDGGPVDVTVAIASQASPPTVGTRQYDMLASTDEETYNCVLSTTKALVASRKAAEVAYYDLDTGTNTPTINGSEQASGMDEMTDAVTLDSNNGILIGGTGTGGTIEAVVCQTGGGTISVGSLQNPAGIEAAAGSYVKGAEIDSTHILTIYQELTTDHLRAVVLTVSGTTVTAGSPVTLKSGLGGSGLPVRVGTSSTYGILYNDAGVAKFRTVTVSGTTVTDGADEITVDGSRTYVDAWYYTGSDNIYVLLSGGFYSILSTGLDALRILRLDTDTTNLYATMIEGGTQKLKYYDLANLAAQGTATFGSVDYADPDTQTAGLFPVVRPGADQVVYVHGRDGNSKQVQVNDLNGTLGWQDCGPGTGTWGTAKFCTALLPDILNPLDVVAAFSDGAVYRSDDNTGTGSWVLYGTATAGTVTVGLRQAGLRFALANNEHLLAGTAAGTIMYTPNYGISWDEVGGTAIGTVNWFAESY